MGSPVGNMYCLCNTLRMLVCIFYNIYKIDHCSFCGPFFPVLNFFFTSLLKQLGEGIHFLGHLHDLKAQLRFFSSPVVHLPSVTCRSFHF
jgi:hypothetical protein